MPETAAREEGRRQVGLTYASSRAPSTVVETAENVAEQAVETAEDVVETAEDVGEAVLDFFF